MILCKIIIKHINYQKELLSGFYDPKYLVFTACLNISLAAVLVDLFVVCLFHFQNLDIKPI